MSITVLLADSLGYGPLIIYGGMFALILIAGGAIYTARKGHWPASTLAFFPIKVVCPSAGFFAIEDIRLANWEKIFEGHDQSQRPILSSRYFRPVKFLSSNQASESTAPDGSGAT